MYVRSHFPGTADTVESVPCLSLRVMYDTILVPTDGSPGSRLAVEHAVSLAERYDATLHCLSVVDEEVYGHYAGVDAIENAEEALAERAEEALAAAVSEADAADVPVETRVERGVPHEVIHRAASDVDLVVMGTERRSGEYRRLLGSVTERVVRLTDTPVLVVKAAEQ